MSLLFRILGLVFLAALLTGGLAFLIFLDNFEIHSNRQISLIFQQDGNRMEGDLILPDGEGPHPVALLVHGDGAQDRTAGLGYIPIINHLVDQGIGVYSWDKPGVGQSTGNWLDQDMTDRAKETLAAIATLRAQPEVNPNAVGVIGFSQAGWVLPEIPDLVDAAEMGEPAFYVIIGGSINWAEQSLYLTRKRLEQEGMEEADIKAELIRVQAENKQLFANTPPPETAFAGMTLDRSRFVHRNYQADSQADLVRITKPFLAIMGAEDLNVDARKSVAVYQEKLAGKHPANQFMLLPDASHGLLKASDYNYQLASQWPFWTQIQFLMEGKDAFSPGVLDQLSGWIGKQVLN